MEKVSRGSCAIPSVIKSPEGERGSLYWPRISEPTGLTIFSNLHLPLLRPRIRPVQTNGSPTMLPRVGPRARTQEIGTALGWRLCLKAGKLRRGTSGGARGSCGSMPGRAGSTKRLMYMGTGMEAQCIYPLVCLEHLERAVEGEFTIYIRSVSASAISCSLA